jgi:4-amino-4-deoxy-L-arabinose transferase-like glycosyltransferase
VDADQVPLRRLSKDRLQEARNRRVVSARIAPILLCLAAFGLRLGPLWANRFHSDEALYASWALAIAYGRDRLLALAAPDKPPLLFYLMAAAFFILGHTEVAARLIGLIVGMVSVALVWQLRPVRSGVAATAMALSPMAILFSPTAFLDPPMVMFALASLVAVTRKRPGWAGMLLGLAAATKVQALIFLPLVFAYAIVASLAHRQDAKMPGLKSCRLRALAVRFVAGLALPLAVVLAWDRVRGGAPFWVQQTINYGGIRLVYASEVMPRLIGWASFLPYFFGWPMLAVLAIGLPLLLIYDLTRGARTQAATFDLVLIAFALSYFMFHWLLAFPVWDRYIFGLVPVMCLLVGRLGDLLAGELTGWLCSPRAAGLVTVGVVAVLMFVPASEAAQSAVPVGGDHGPHDGLDRVADYLRSYPYGTVVYDHWLGWTLRYYLWDSRIYVAYFATPQALAEDLHVFGRTSPRFIVVPATESTTRIERAIAAEGFVLSPVLSTQDRHSQPTFTVYRIESDGRSAARDRDAGLAYNRSTCTSSNSPP